MKLAFLFTYLLLFVLAGCTTTPTLRILPGDQYHTAIVRDNARDGAEIKASDAAKEYCDRLGRSTYFISNETYYTGQTMGEGARETLRRTAGVTAVAGAIAGTQEGSRDLGAVIGTAGVAGYALSQGNDYKAEVKFTCN